MPFLQASFWWLDFAVAAGVVAAVALLRWRGVLGGLTFRLFWVGCLFGLAWEVPLSTLDGLGLVRIFAFLTPPPAHFTVVIVSHTLWDGALFLVGVLLVRATCAPPWFRSFRGRELAVLIAWGQLQSLGVELLATGTAGWTYVPSWWNPALVGVRGHALTLLPQLIWLLAAPAFYLAALRLQAAAARELAAGRTA